MKRIFSTLLLIVTVFSLSSQNKVLFIGDSITDGNWGNAGGSAKPSDERSHWDMNHIYGSGYMYLCATHYQGNYPECNYEFYNRGISGNTLADLQKRWQKDVLDINPDVLSILIGTNDIAQFIDNKGADGWFDFEGWEARYRALLEASINQNPEVKLILCAPFVAYTGNMKKRDDFDLRQTLVSRCAEIVGKIATDYHATYLPFNELFAALQESTPPEQESYWIWDGIHPTPAGHKRIADLWIENFR